MRVFFFLLLIIPFKLIAQSPTKIEVFKAFSDKREFMDTTICDKYYQAAIKDIQRKNLNYLTLSFFNYYEDTVANYYFKNTEWLWLKENTPFVRDRKPYQSDSLISSDDLPAEIACYDIVFLKFKNTFFGEEFSTEVIKHADSLRDKDLGYKAIRILEQDIEKKIIQSTMYNVDFNNINDTMILSKNALRANIKIDESGKIMNITCWFTNQFQGPYKRSINPSNKYVKDATRIIQNFEGFTSATYKNKPIEESITIYFPYTEN